MKTQTELSSKQQRFCDEYLTDMNATRAALAAGYSKSTALSGQLMNMPAIAGYLAGRLKAIREQFEVSHQMIVAELAKIAFANVGNYFADDGRLKPMQQLTDKEKAALWNLKVTEHTDGSTTVQLRLCSKLSALEKLAKHTGFYKMTKKEKVEELTAKQLAKDAELDAEYFRLEKWGDELLDKKLELDEREKELVKLEEELKRKKSECGGQKPDVGGTKGAQADACASIGILTNRDVDVATEPVKIIGHLPGQYTPEGYLIKTDMPADRDITDPNYNPFACRYIEKKTGTMLIKSYLLSPPDDVMESWRRSKAAMFKALKAEALEN